VLSAGNPLHHCATHGKLAMAEMLLEAGADPNLHVYAAGSAVHRAYTSGNAAMIALLERHGGVVEGTTVGTLLHDLSGERHDMPPDDRVAIATMLLDASARLDVRDDLLASTPLGWACRWGRVELVRLFLERGADPAEADAESWATPRA
jgi:ankyrin repeat protein